MTRKSDFYGHCSKHGAYADHPDVQAGCPICLEELDGPNEPPEPVRGLDQFPDVSWTDLADND